MIVTRISKTRLLLAAGACAFLLSLAIVARYASHRDVAAFALPMGPPPITKTSAGMDGSRLQNPAAPEALHILRGCFNAEFDRDWAMTRGATPWLQAALTQDWAQVHELARNIATLDAGDVAGTTPLMIAARHGAAQVVSELLALNANPNATDREGRTALHYAIAAEQSTTVSALLPTTAVSELRSPDGSDLVDLALATGNWEVSTRLLEYFPASSSWSAPALAMLRNAASANDEAHGRLLMEKHTAQPPLEGHAVPLLAHAIVSGNASLSRTLLRFGANPNTIVPAPCEKSFLASIKSNYLRPYVEADSGITVLMLAAGLGDTELVQALLAAGANRNLMTAHYKMLPLYFSTRTPSWRTTQVLLGSGAPPEALRIEVSLGTQHVAVVKNGEPILTTSCSTGREGFSTPAGSYVITDKDRDHRSTIYKVAMPFFMRLNCRDFGLHEGNVGSARASHGCIRLPSEIARKLFSEIPVGTVVNIN